ncbi:hypothetical protein IPG41_04395 [Candidatus Peregrinibacteria bacterium]|nr:MAG: hypothetical protein IPG41_04395 [Candidatus Peregrinibacteria bacterium]
MADTHEEQSGVAEEQGHGEKVSPDNNAEMERKKAEVEALLDRQRDELLQLLSGFGVDARVLRTADLFQASLRGILSGIFEGEPDRESAEYLHGERKSAILSRAERVARQRQREAERPPPSEYMRVRMAAEEAKSAPQE